MALSNEEKQIIIDMICEKQNQIIAMDHMQYGSDKYKCLERLKVKIKNM